MLQCITPMPTTTNSITYDTDRIMDMEYEYINTTVQTEYSNMDDSIEEHDKYLTIVPSSEKGKYTTRNNSNIYN